MQIPCRYCGERVHVDSAEALRYVIRDADDGNAADSLIVESAAGGDRLVHSCALQSAQESNEWVGTQRTKWGGTT